MTNTPKENEGKAINNTVSIPEGTKSRVIRCTPQLRWHWPHGFGINKPKVLQQAWQGVEDGIIEWRNVPDEVSNG